MMRTLEDIALNETIFSKIVGTTFRPVPFASIGPQTPILLQREPSNPADPNAIRVLCFIHDMSRAMAECPDLKHHNNWIQIGYIRKELAANLSPAMDAGQCNLEGVITEITQARGTENHGINIVINIKHLDLRHLLAMNPFFKEPNDEPTPERAS